MCEYREKSLYIFDLDQKPIDPVITFDSADAKFSAVTFAPDSNVVLVAH